jgi:tripartite-type tricarboxylate transporter receptor subunit TctC
MLVSRRRFAVFAALMGATLAAAPIVGAGPAAAQKWPQRSVKFIVPLGAGSGVDIGTRLFADKLSKEWGQPAVVENRPGGDALVALGAFVSAADDHVLLASPSSSFTHHPHVYKSVPYQPGDLKPIARVSNTILVIAVPTTLEVKNMADLVAMAKKEPGKLNWVGTTGAVDFVFASFLKTAGLDMSKVPYRNPVEASNDLAAGRVHVYAAALAIVRPQLQAGKIKLIAVMNTTRSPTHPDLQTVTEAGFPDLAFNGLVGFFGPTVLPDAVRDSMAAEVRAAGTDPTIAERLATTGQMQSPGGPAEFAAEIDQQRARVAKAAKDLGIVPTQ